MNSKSMNASIIVVAIDGWNPSHLEAYGAGTPRTPALNQIACHSALVETCLADSLELDEVYRSYWEGSHALERRLRKPASQPPLSLAQCCREAGLPTTFLLDESDSNLIGLASSFDICETWNGEAPRRLAESLEETHMARFMMHALALIESNHDPRLYWLHVSSLQKWWDAPYEMRSALVDDEDPAAPDFVLPPQFEQVQEPDPDYLLGVHAAYGAQLAAWDSCLDLLWQAFLARNSLHPTLLLLTSPRGMALGGHGQLGPGCQHLYSETIHAPLLVSTPGLMREPCRFHGILQPPCVFATLTAWIHQHRARTMALDRMQQTSPLLATNTTGECRELNTAFVETATHWAVRTPGWFCSFPKSTAADSKGHPFQVDEDAERVELYAKPDDRWDDNELARRCPEIVAAMASRGHEFISNASLSQVDSMGPLEERLGQEGRRRFLQIDDV